MVVVVEVVGSLGTVVGVTVVGVTVVVVVVDEEEVTPVVGRDAEPTTGSVVVVVVVVLLVVVVELGVDAVVGVVVVVVVVVVGTVVVGGGGGGALSCAAGTGVPGGVVETVRATAVQAPASCIVARSPRSLATLRFSALSSWARITAARVIALAASRRLARAVERTASAA